MSDQQHNVGEPGDKFWLTAEEAAALEITADSQCLSCAWHDDANPSLARCRVFPNGIPLQILTNKADHRLPYPGDSGWRWEPRPSTEIVSD